VSKKTLDGRVIAITGAARGIGLATAQALVARGARVAMGDLDGDLAAVEAAALGSAAFGTSLDITDEASFAAFLDATEDRFGPVDVLINNAGIMPIGALLDEPADLARRALLINVSGGLIGMKAVLPGMLHRGSGHVVNIASVAGKSPVPGGLTYAATKAAVVSMTESARVEFAGTGINFTCVMPSFTNTELIAGTKGTKLVPTVQPEDVAKAIVKAIAKPRADVFVPRMLGPIVWGQPLMGRKVRDKVNSMLGADTVFLDFDPAARAAYAQRIEGSPMTSPKRARA
jgi:NAD(P)-dependent dehydrogenase (short-subunit alcohol dehydrogenase family)